MRGALNESRKHIRLNLSFAVSLHKAGISMSFEGHTKNVSQGGAFIRSKDWSAFQKDDQALITFYLPPNFTGQDVTMRLLGTAVVKRVDQDNKGLGIQFNKSLRQFERIC